MPGALNRLRPLLRSVLALVKVSRPGFWPTTLWFFILPFAGLHMFGTPAFWLGATYVCFPLGLLLYGWNDIGDAQTDAENPRKDSWIFGARPGETLRRRLPWIIAAVQLPFLVAFVAVAGVKMLGWFAAVLLTNATYNNLGFKARPVLDVLNQAGYVLVFVLASWLCDVPQLNPAAVAFSALFAMLSHVFGQLMDLDQDRDAGRRSTAVVLGTRWTKLLLVAILAVEAGIAWRWFSSWYVAGFMGAAAVFFALDALAGPTRYPVSFTKVFFVGWNLVVLTTMHFVWRLGVFQLS